MKQNFGLQQMLLMGELILNHRPATRGEARKPKHWHLKRQEIERLRDDYWVYGIRGSVGRSLTQIIRKKKRCDRMVFGKHKLGNKTTLLFDIDGTLLDSHGFLIKTQFQILQKHYPGAYTYEQVESKFGTDYLTLVKAVDSVGYQAVLDEFIAIKISGYHFHTKLFPGVPAVLRQLKEQGFKLGVVTNQHKEAFINMMQKTELTHMFETVIALEDMPKRKPAPDGIEMALKHLGSVPSETVMIGDSKADMLAAKNAGTTSVLLKWYGEVDMSICPPDLEYSKLDDFIEELTAAQKDRSA
jgi:pyrophosphatase PpaX